tara:strand:- start:127 stop:873 length:747 start_codon:yes stop_codon:yes gene_type:complete
MKNRLLVIIALSIVGLSTYSIGLITGFYSFFPVPQLIDLKNHVENKGFSAQSNFEVIDTSKKNMLILGDSISLGYTPYLQQMLSGTYDVYRIKRNTRHTGFGTRLLNEYFETQKFNCDIVTFNFGLWDIAYVLKAFGDDGFQLSTPIEYSKNLQEITSSLKKNCRNVIFILTTPVPTNDISRANDDVILYNNIASEIMATNGVHIIDLYQFAKNNEFITNDVHFTENQSLLIAKFIVTNLQSILSTNE